MLWPPLPFCEVARKDRISLKAEEGSTRAMLSPGVCFRGEDTLEESLGRHPLDREQGPAPLAVVAGPTGRRRRAMNFSHSVKLLVSPLRAAASPALHLNNPCSPVDISRHPKVPNLGHSSGPSAAEQAVPGSNISRIGQPTQNQNKRNKRKNW